MCHLFTTKDKRNKHSWNSSFPPVYPFHPNQTNQGFCSMQQVSGSLQEASGSFVLQPQFFWIFQLMVDIAWQLRGLGDLRFHKKNTPRTYQLFEHRKCFHHTFFCGSVDDLFVTKDVTFRPLCSWWTRTWRHLQFTGSPGPLAPPMAGSPNTRNYLCTAPFGIMVELAEVLVKLCCTGGAIQML